MKERLKIPVMWGRGASLLVAIKLWGASLRCGRRIPRALILTPQNSKIPNLATCSSLSPPSVHRPPLVLYAMLDQADISLDPHIHKQPAQRTYCHAADNNNKHSSSVAHFSSWNAGRRLTEKHVKQRNQLLCIIVLPLSACFYYWNRLFLLACASNQFYPFLRISTNTSLRFPTLSLKKI